MIDNILELEASVIETRESGIASLTFIDIGNDRTQNVLVVAEDLFSQVFHFVTTTFGLQDGHPFRLQLDAGIVWVVPIRNETYINEFEHLEIECCGYTVLASIVIGPDAPLEVQQATCAQEGGGPPRPLCDDCGSTVSFNKSCVVCEWVKSVAETGGG